MPRPLTEKALEIIRAVQALKQFAICDGIIYRRRRGWYQRVLEYWYQIPAKLMDESGLQQDILDLELALSFTVSDAMMNAPADELRQNFCLSD